MGMARGRWARAKRRLPGIAVAVAAGWLAVGGWGASALPLFPEAAWRPGPGPEERTTARDAWPPREPWAIAHRGASMQAPENTLAAFDLAVAKGADVIELDVRRSRDGRLVVMHDATVDRTTDGTGRVADLTWDELRRLDAGGSFGPDFAGEPVPSLEEVLDRYAGRVGLLIELKEPLLYPDMLRDLAEALERRGLQDGEGGRVAVQSFDAGAIRRLRTLTPRLPIGVVVGDKPSAAITEEDLERLAAFANFVNLRLDMVNRELIASVHAQGMRVFAWTVRHPDEIPPLLEAGVDGIVTDDPELVPKR